jgi:arabinan endo-1,5-alpha-L-arabinosidase
MTRPLSILAVLALAGCALQPVPETYVNPVLARAFPDPAVLRAPDGTYYAYATQGEGLNIQLARSEDLVHWTVLGDALPHKPAWASGKQKFWAPHVLYDEKRSRYFMYYSAEPNDATGKCLAVATSAEPAGPFSDSGRPLLCGQGIENIDPMAFDDPRTGKQLLYWGSGRLPIRVRELAADRLSFLETSPETELVFPDEKPYRSLVEAAWVIFRDGWYYLFYSGDLCCGPNARYAVMVARSRSALGPFEDRPAPIVEENAQWRAPGHNSVATDPAGNDWMLYHAIAVARFAEGERFMLLGRIRYQDGWPVVEVR